jgi:phage replication O-like protein O
MFDEIFKTLNEGELRVVLVLVRQTFGWHKSFDRISLSQLAEKTGMVRTSVCRSLSTLIEKGLVIKKKFGSIGQLRCYYSLAMEEMTSEKEDPSEGIESEEEMAIISNNSDQSPKETRVVSQRDQGSLLKRHTKETLSKETKKKHDDDDAREPEKKVPYEIEITSPSGKKSGVTKSDVFRHFVGKPYKTETIERALKRFIERGDRVSDFYRYLESVCATIEANEHPIETKSYKKQKLKKDPETEPQKQYVAGCGEGGWFEIERQYKEKLKNQRSLS